MNKISNLVGRMSFLTMLASLAVISSCDATVEDTADNAQDASVGILVFGDSGYHLDYPDQDDFIEMFTAEGFAEAEWLDWVEDKRPQDEFEVRPSEVSPITGQVVASTGMHLVATAMKAYCRDTAICDFGVMLGDNIYPSGATLGADGRDDAQRFHDMFAVPFGNFVEDPDDYVTYVTLGNHDWETSREGGFKQISYLEETDGFYMDGPFYSVKPAGANGDIELFVIDTSMLLASVPVFEDYLNDDGSEVTTDIVEPPDYAVEPLTEAERNMPAWLEDALKNSTAKWKLVIAHHPIWSSAGSKFEQARALRKLILPAMCRYADAYIVGHDHTLEIHTDSCEAALSSATEKPLVQIVSGAAAKLRPLNTAFMWHQTNKYPEHNTIWAEGLLWGFAHMTIEGDIAKVTILSVPDDETSKTSVGFEYQFERRSHLNH